MVISDIWPKNDTKLVLQFIELFFEFVTIYI